jgi:hypothetical protein
MVVRWPVGNACIGRLQEGKRAVLELVFSVTTEVVNPRQ